MDKVTRKHPFFTIVMVTFNAEKCINRSLESLVSQTCLDWELRLVDGESSDSTLDIVKSMNFNRCIITSIPDNGIYDAMNYGVNSSSGDWILFLNAGDLLHNPNVMDDVKNCIEQIDLNPDLVYGDIEIFDGIKSERLVQEVDSDGDFKFRIPLCHQSVFYSRRCFENGNRYDMRYAVCADYYHMAKLFLKGYKFVKCNAVIAKYSLGGFSHRKLQTLQCERLQIVRELFGFWGALQFIPKFLYEYAKATLILYCIKGEKNA